MVGARVTFGGLDVVGMGVCGSVDVAGAVVVDDPGRCTFEPDSDWFAVDDDDDDDVTRKSTIAKPNTTHANNATKKMYFNL